MTLQVRKPPFQIDETVPFQWQPANPAFGLFGNVFTFLAIAFERYLVAATRQGLDRITDPAVAEEADLFVRQEAQHARAHRAHAMAMIAHHPGLQETYDALGAAYDELLAEEDVEFHLAYVANLEATFTPLFKLVFDHRQPLFAGGDERVGTLLLWHFAEEIEHRSSALLIHQAVTPDRWYRMRKAPKVFRHVTARYQQVVDGIAEHVGTEACGIDPQVVAPTGLYTTELRRRYRLLPSGDTSVPSMLGHVPGRDLRRLVRHLARSQTPSHNPATEDLPPWVDEWFAAYDVGEDITTYAGARL
jgi:predicted metal-dependent hydrolase